MTCDKCGAAIQLGEWPFCPHGFPLHGVSVIDDQLEGGARWCETMGHDPVWLDGTKSQWRREMDARGLQCVGERRSTRWHERNRKQHDEMLRDTKQVRA